MKRKSFMQMTTWSSRVLLIVLIPVQYLSCRLITKTVISQYSNWFNPSVMLLLFGTSMIIDAACVTNGMFSTKRLLIYIAVQIAIISLLIFD